MSEPILGQLDFRSDGMWAYNGHYWVCVVEGDWTWMTLRRVNAENPTPITDSEKAADQMRQDILGGKIDKAGRQVVRDACDKMDAPKAGRDASNEALGNISRRGF